MAFVLSHLVLINSLSPSPYLSLEVACIQFINAIITTPDDLDFRVHLRNEVLRAGLDEALASVPEQPGEDLAVQLEVFEYHREEDVLELQGRFGDIRFELEYPLQAVNVSVSCKFVSDLYLPGWVGLLEAVTSVSCTSCFLFCLPSLKKFLDKRFLLSDPTELFNLLLHMNHDTKSYPHFLSILQHLIMVRDEEHIRFVVQSGIEKLLETL